jgi:hypothetical protein
MQLDSRRPAGWVMDAPFVGRVFGRIAGDAPESPLEFL